MNVTRLDIKGRVVWIRAHHGKWKEYRLTKPFKGSVSIKLPTCSCKNCKARRAAKRRA